MSSPSAAATSKRRSSWRAWGRGRRRAVELRWASTVSSILCLPTTITSSPPPVAPFRPVISISLPAPRPPSPSQDPSPDLPRLRFVGGREHQRLVAGTSTHGQGGGRWVLPRQWLLYAPMSKLLASSGFW